MTEQVPKTRLQAERIKRQLTQEEVAEEIGEEAKTLSRWERGCQVAGLRKRRLLSAFFKEEVDASWFVPLEKEPSSRILHVPYERNPYFTDQRHRVEHLHERLHAGEIGACCQGISGLGGTGKTQLALEYAYRYQDDYMAVLWVNASTQPQLLGDLASVAKILQVPEAKKRAPKQRYLVNEAIHWLQTHQGWLLILDNVEEGLDTEEPDDVENGVKINRLLSSLNAGHILLTTRSQAVARQAQNLLLEAMQPEEGAQLLLLRSHQRTSFTIPDTARASNREEAIALSGLLGGLPLALEQARAYIEATGCGFVGYRQLYKECRKQLLQEVIKDSRLEKEYKESVATTWLISFRHVERQFAVASDVLKLYAYLAPDAIPDDIVLKGAETLDSGVHELAGNKFQFNRVRQVLLNYSLVTQNTEEPMLSIHRLVQAILQDRMDEREQHFWAEQAVQAVQRAFYSATEQAVEQYIPQVQTCATLIEKYRLEGQEVAYLLKMAAKAVDKRGWYVRAQPLYIQAFHAHLRCFGSDDTRTLHLLFDVLHIHADMGQSPFAAHVYKRIIADFKRVLGPDHPDLLVLLNHVTWVQFASGEFESAARTGMEAIQLLRRIPDADAVERAVTYQVAAELSVLSGRIDLAESYYQEAKALFEQTLGPQHREVADVLANWGGLYAIRGNLEQAERLLRQAVEIRQRTCGRDHPETADGLVILAAIVWHRGHYDEAEEYYQQALTIRQQKLGQYNPGVLQILRSLAQLASVQKRDEEAERHFRDALALAPIVEETMSDEYALLLKAYADFLRDRGRTEEAADFDK